MVAANEIDKLDAATHRKNRKQTRQPHKHRHIKKTLGIHIQKTRDSKKAATHTEKREKHEAKEAICLSVSQPFRMS